MSWKDQSEVQAVYDQGSIGFVDWMLAKNDLTTKQKNDLDWAKNVLQNACEEDFSKWAGGNNTGLPESRNNKVVVTGDKKDAISLENTKATFAVLNKINSLRDTDENYVGAMKRNAAKTNFYRCHVRIWRLDILIRRQDGTVRRHLLTR